MAMEITNNYSAYENTYAAQKQETAKQQATSRKETSETVVAQKNSAVGNSNAKRTVDYAKKLEKLAPSVEFHIGTTHSSAKSGKTLTINPQLLEKMQNDPKQEKETKEMIKGVEAATKLLDSIHKASGWTVVYRHGYIDENGKYSSCAYVRNDFMLNMSDKLREERKENSEKLIEKAKENSVKKEEELQETLEEKRTEKEDKTSKAEKIISDKIDASKDGIIYLYDTDMKEIMETIKEDNAGKTDSKTQMQVGANLDLQA